ncbi:MAG: SDR family oxidoreductase [Anaerolineales bacterium]|nr:SDR family oxidoreductase [Anaerolineales bacterium]
MISFNSKVCLVTGGGSGIGRGIALAISNLGAKLVVCGRREGMITETANQIRRSGGECLPVRADVSSLEDVQRLVEMTIDKYKKVDVLVNNAGIGGGGNIHNHDVASWDQIMAVNLRGPFLLSREVLKHMRAQRYGHIVNISSESGLEYYPGNGAYGVSKHALNDLGEYIQRENQEFNIRVDTICPGMVVTEMSENNPGLDHSKCLYPEDIADLVVWLVTRRENVKIGRPILIQTMENPWT